MIILIADDDRLIRFTIKSILGEILGDVRCIFLEAANGRDMVRMCMEETPDIAFVDIRMPYLDGLRAIAECKKYSKWTEYVVVSGYSDFAYAQTGIRLGITEYLLKPVDEEQLRPVIEQLQQKLEKQKVDSNARFQLRVMEMFNYHATIEFEEYEEEPLENGCVYLAFLLQIKAGMSGRAESLALQKSMLKSIKKTGEEITRRKGYYGITNTAEGTVCAVFGVSEGEQDYVLSHMQKISMLAQKEYDVCFYIPWVCRNTLKEIYSACEKLDEEDYLFVELSSGNLHEYTGELPAEEEREFLFQINRLLNAWVQADGIVCREVINAIWRKYKESGKHPNVDIENLSKYCSSVCGFPVDSRSWKLFFASFVEHSEQMYSGVAVEEIDMADQVKEYIQKNYMNDISISQIAEEFGLTANYLSTLFHRKTGGKFIDYLTNIRIEAAKKLLVQNVSATVQDVALMVGYNSARHFSSLFQKQTGETPSSYRKNRRK